MTFAKLLRERPKGGREARESHTFICVRVIGVCQRNFLTGLWYVKGHVVVYGFRFEQSNTWPSI